VLLAGGQSRRMGGLDKGLQALRGKPMVQWVIERFAPQVDELLINANQNHDAYGAYGHRVVPDEITGYAGPLAGLHRGLSEAQHDLVATVPCDSPFLPDDLVMRLYSAIERSGSQVAVVTTRARRQPVFCLCRTELLPGLTAFLGTGGRTINAWYDTLDLVEVAFDDCPEAFSNINTESELRGFEQAK
jgi:molybdopterin-guanine dinucleotide biosynthesis protein A